MNGVLESLAPLGAVLTLLAGALVVVLLDCVLRREDRPVLPLAALVTVFLAAVASARSHGAARILSDAPFSGSLVADGLSSGITFVVLIAAGLSILGSSARTTHSRLGTGSGGLDVGIAGDLVAHRGGC